MKVVLRIVAGQTCGKSFEYTQADTLLFGRASDAHVQIAGDKMVSRNHFSLLISESECRVRDLGSANGTYVGRTGRFFRYGGSSTLPNGAVAAPDGALDTALHDGDTISVGETRIEIMIETEEDKTCIQASAPDNLERTMQQNHPPIMAVETPHVMPETKTAVLTVIEQAAKFEARFPNAPRFDGYEILEKLGEGGMGVVVKARRANDGKFVAIKTMIPPKGPNASKMIEAFEREVRVHAGLKHPQIVEQLDVVRSGPVLGVVLEFVDGMDLSQLIQSHGGKLAIADAGPLMLDILAGLAHAHAAGVVHRDLKPENVFVMNTVSRWVAKVADFGLAKSYEATGKSLFEIAGTPPFWPREHVTSYASLYPASDVFSIAAVFYLMLTGIHARDGMNAMLEKVKAAKRRPGFGDYVQVLATGKVVPIEKNLPGIPSSVAAVLNRALREEELPESIQKDKNALRAKLAEMRYPNAGAFRDALALALRSSNA